MMLHDVAHLTGRVPRLIFSVGGLLTPAVGGLAYGWGDFALFHESARRWLDSGLFYSGTASLNMNLPHVSVLFVPWAALPLPVAWVTWQATNLLLLAVLIRWLALPRAWVLAVLLSSAWLMQAALAQIAVVLAVLVTGAWHCHRRGRGGQAGIWLGIAVAIKPFLLPLVAWWLLRREWKAAGTALAVGAGILILGLLTLGTSAYEQWVATLARMPDSEPLNIALWGAVRRAVRIEWQRAAWLTAASLVAIGTAIRVRHVSSDRAWVALLIAGLLTSPLGWAYYGMLLIGPLSTLARSEWSVAWWGLWIPAGVGMPAWSIGTLAWALAWGAAIAPTKPAEVASPCAPSA